MALQMNVPLPGGIEHANGYVRVTDVRVCRKDDADDWFMMIDVAAYKDAKSRADKVRLVAPAVDKFKFTYVVNDGASHTVAYAKVKLAVIHI